MAEDTAPDITALTVQLLSAFVSNNSVPSENLADLIKTTRAALIDDVSAGANAPAQEAHAEHVPAVSIRKSLASDEHVISLIDGKPYKTLKRHLASHGLTPEQYRERYKLPKTYPLVARSYSQARRAVAEKLGLGRKPVAKSAQAVNAAPVATAPESAKAKEVSPAKAAKAAPKKPARTKAATAPAMSAAKSNASAQKPVAGEQKSARSPRRRLSIAGPKAASPAPAAAPREPAKSQPTAKSPVKKPVAARKAKAAPKPKASKDEARDAGAAAKGGKQTPEATSAE